MSGRLIALDKQPDMRPFGIGETWRHIFDKIVQKVAGPEVTMACQDDQLWSGPKAVIDGAVHRVQYIWDEDLTTEDWGFLLVDANNAFNKMYRVGTLWTFRNLWPPGACFVFNCYRHWSLLFLQNRNGTASFLNSKEGVTQGDPLAMIVYGIGILPLINNHKQDIPDVIQPW